MRNLRQAQFIPMTNWRTMKNMETQPISVYLPQLSAAKYELTARELRLRRGTLMRLVLEKWLADPLPLFDLPPQRDEQ
jgi:hypothetical protein